MPDLYLRTAIKPEIEKRSRKIGRKALFIAASLVVTSEYVLPLLELETLGGWAWLAGSGLAGLGLIPHQRVSSRQKHPYILHSTEDSISLHKDNKCLLNIPWSQIESIQFIDRGKEYGLAFILKSPLKSISKRCRKRYGVDLFLPYFSQASFHMLEKWQNERILT